MKIGAGPNEWPQLQARPSDHLLHQDAAKKFAAYEAAKPVAEFDPQNRDKNVDYYVAKLDDLVKNFGTVAAASQAAEKQASLAL